MASYSFLDISAAIAGPGGNFSLGSDAGAAEEGISIAMTNEKNTMTVGADGSVMHSLHGSRSGTLTVRLLKTSPVNARLAELYAVQSQSSILHGRNVITIRDVARGDSIACHDCAFAKFPDTKFAKDGGTMDWVFHAGRIDQHLGSGWPEKAA